MRSYVSQHESADEGVDIRGVNEGGRGPNSPVA